MLNSWPRTTQRLEQLLTLTNIRDDGLGLMVLMWLSRPCLRGTSWVWQGNFRPQTPNLPLPPSSSPRWRKSLLLSNSAWVGTKFAAHLVTHNSLNTQYMASSSGGRHSPTTKSAAAGNARITLRNCLIFMRVFLAPSSWGDVERDATETIAL